MSLTQNNFTGVGCTVISCLAIYRTFSSSIIQTELVVRAEYSLSLVNGGSRVVLPSPEALASFPFSTLE